MKKTKRNLQDWLAWQETLHPSTIDLGLERVRQVYELLGSPEPANTVVTIGGTNGKGSCVALLSEIYRAAGYQVGAYTSPHLLSYNERIAINGDLIDDTALCDAFERIDHARGAISLTYFEFGTLAALLCFANAKLDVAILEVGLGGRLDATNIIDADIALVTTVDLDHEDWLGDTREKIAFEKAGIFRSGKVGIYADDHPPASLLQTAQQREIQLKRLRRDYSYHLKGDHWDWKSDVAHYQTLPLPNMAGEAQYKNAAAVIMAITELQATLPVQQANIEQGLRQYRLAGRYNKVAVAPAVILDVAHNPQAVKELVATITRQPAELGQLWLVLGIFKDKNVSEVIRLLAEVADGWWIATLNSPRAMPAAEIATSIRRFNPEHSLVICENPVQAYEKAVAAAKPEDTILVTGSFLTVAAVMSHIKNG